MKKRIYKPSEMASQTAVPDTCGAEPPGEQEHQAFPLDCLPPAAADMARAICITERVPETLAGCCILGVISAAIGAGLQVQSGPDRVTRGNLYLLASADSGSGKSETYRHAIKPFQDVETAMLADWKAQSLPRLLADKELIELEIETRKKDARNKKGVVEREDVRIELQAKRAELLRIENELEAPRLIVEDVTTQKLAVMLEKQGESMASFSSDAGGIVSNILGRYNKLDRTDENIYLKAFTGEACRVDRQGRAPVMLNRPCLVALWLVQPDKIDTLLGEQSLTEGGLIPRFLTCHTWAEAKPISGDAPGIPLKIAEAWDLLVQGLLRTFRLFDQFVTIAPTPEAKEVLRLHFNEIVKRRGPDGDLRDVAIYVSRWNEQAWRIAVCIHAAKYGSTAGEKSLDIETAQNAIKLADWFAAQQLEILSISRMAVRQAQQDKVLGLLAEKPQGITVRELQRLRIWSTASETHAILEGMVADGILEPSDVDTGGRPQRIYVRNRKR